jgi:hypothetical protein
MLKSCVVCGLLYAGPGARCPEHTAAAQGKRNTQRQVNRARRTASRRDEADVREAMATAVAAAGRCASCGAEPYGTITLHAHLPRKYGKVHLPLPGIYTVLCSVCHGQVTRTDGQ